jgi:hypothetical protein
MKVAEQSTIVRDAITVSRVFAEPYEQGPGVLSICHHSSDSIRAAAQR